MLLLSMRSTLTFSILALLLVACGACGARQYPDEVPTLSDPAVGLLITIEDGSELSMCTAWKADSKHIVTAGHCCEPTYKYLIKGPHTYPGALYSEVAYDDDEHDVCVIRAQMSGPALNLAALDPVKGQAVWTAGYPQGVYLISDGYWSGRDAYDRPIVSTAVWGGASGSAVYNSKGEVVGIISKYRAPQSNLAILVPIEWIKVALQLAP